ncbi:MAG: hemerythrin domain-containing protein [Proteobacteria bacterium]|nr:hemerythrin domain-containing protein [Pseudomonadota bacterium]
MNQVSLISGLRSERPVPSADAPRPMSFAVLRNTHEAFRTSIRLQEQALVLDDPISFRTEWQGFRRALAVHVAMEEAMFDVLDEVGNGALQASRTGAEHDEDERSAARVDAALAAGDLSMLFAAWTTWHGRHLRHLANEEQIVTPLTMKTGATPQARGRVVHDRILTPTEGLPDFDWSVGWVVRLLGEFGSTAQPPRVATRVYAWGLQNACSRSQWRRLRPVVQSHCAPEIWDEMASQFGLDGEGAIG